MSECTGPATTIPPGTWCWPTLDPSLFRTPPPITPPVATRPQDWAPRARAVLYRREAWRT